MTPPASNSVLKTVWTSFFRAKIYKLNFGINFDGNTAFETKHNQKYVTLFSFGTKYRVTQYIRQCLRNFLLSVTNSALHIFNESMRFQDFL